MSKTFSQNSALSKKLKPVESHDLTFLILIISALILTTLIFFSMKLTKSYLTFNTQHENISTKASSPRA